MSEEEQAFWDWWHTAEPYKDQITLRMAFDAGYEARKNNE